MSLENKIKKYLINYTQECIDELVENLKDNPNVLKKDVLSFLRTKYSIKGCPPRGQRNYWILRGFSKEEAEIKIKPFSKVYASGKIENIMKRHNLSEKDAILERKRRSDKARETFNNKSEEEKTRINKSKGHTYENYVRLYGEDVAKVKIVEFRERISQNCSLEGFIKRHGEVEGRKRWKNFRKKAKKNTSLNGFIERHGEAEGRIKYAETNLKKSKSHTLRGYIDKYGYEQGRKKFEKRQEKWQNTLKRKSASELKEIDRKKGVTYQESVKKHGEEKANAIFSSRYDRNNSRQASKQSLELLLPLYRFCRQNGIDKNDIYIGTGDRREYFISEHGNFYLYDFAVKSLKIIVEYHGVCWHGTSSTTTEKNPFGVPLIESYHRDIRKKECAERNGFELYTVWSDDDIKKEIAKLKDIIYEKINNDV